MNHCRHCNHDKIYHGSKNGCSVCKRECIEYHNTFWENNSKLADMQFGKKGLGKNEELKLWRFWVKNQHFSDSKLFDGKKKQILLQYQLDNISPCMEFDQWWYGHGVSREWYYGQGKNEQPLSTIRVSVDLRSVKLADVEEIVRNEIEEIEREWKKEHKDPPKQTKKGKKK